MTSTSHVASGAHSQTPLILLDHVTVTVADLARSQAFYDAALAPLGVRRVVDYLDPEDEDEAGVEAVGYAGPDDRPVLWLAQGHPPTTAAHVAFRAADGDRVAAFYAAALAGGGVGRQSPRPWQIYRTADITAMVTDPDGNLVEARAAG